MLLESPVLIGDHVSQKDPGSGGRRSDKLATDALSQTKFKHTPEPLNVRRVAPAPLGSRDLGGRRSRQRSIQLPIPLGARLRQRQIQPLLALRHCTACGRTPWRRGWRRVEAQLFQSRRSSARYPQWPRRNTGITGWLLALDRHPDGYAGSPFMPCSPVLRSQRYPEWPRHRDNSGPALPPTGHLLVDPPGRSFQLWWSSGWAPLLASPSKGSDRRLAGIWSCAQLGLPPGRYTGRYIVDARSPSRWPLLFTTIVNHPLRREAWQRDI